ncbi:MAG TPA: CHRD domain-containing protein [Phycisphaerales bacterium]|nr:CHRD domain-containing protein [Phycisphaerales bacterium]HMP36462.1 CHRD domain-containing protein [Phycisphaerales bacterium]
MKRATILGAGALCIGLLCAAPSAAQTFQLNMSGDQEVPPGDPDGFAVGTLTIDSSTNQVSWSFVYGNIAAPTLMHIHIGAAGVNGPIVVNLGIATSGGPGTLISSTTTSAANVAAILANPLGYYVNIHNTPFPGGAVRGQLVPAPATIFDVVLTGDQEVPGPGDPDGLAMGTVTVDPGTNVISWDLEYMHLDDLTGFHIHVGEIDEFGPIVVDLGIATTGGPGSLINSKPGISNATIAALLDNPMGYYLNIHTLKFPAGAVRGPLASPPMEPCPGDFNHDHIVDGADLGTLLGAWGSNSEHEDLNRDGVVDGADLGILLGSWGPCP